MAVASSLGLLHSFHQFSTIQAHCSNRTSLVPYLKLPHLQAAKPSFVVFANTGEASNKQQSLQLYGQIERVIVDTAKNAQGSSGRWQEIQGAWVLWPTKGDPVAIVHFIGGVFVGAAPQLTYRLFLESLSERGLLIVATPFISGFDHFRIADEAQLKFDRCLRSLRNDYVDALDALPIFGVGHSLGSLIHLLIGAKYAVEQEGNVFMSFNHKGAIEAIPIFSPVIVPMAQNLGPILTQFTSSPTVRKGAEMAMQQLQNLTPPILKQVFPLIEQLSPLYEELASGKESFIPSREEAARMVKSYYGVRRNLLIRFKDDGIDETPDLAQMLSSGSSVSASSLDMAIRTLPGDHPRPLQQVWPEVPGNVADAVSRGQELLATLTAGTPFASVAKEMGQSFGTETGSQRLRQQVVMDIQQLVDEIASWMLQHISKRLP